MKIKDLVPSEVNCRTEYVPESIQDLAESIKEDGLISRVVLRKNASGDFEVVAGSRRLKALESLYGPEHELDPQDYVIREFRDEFEAVKMSLSENSQRANLSTLELARAVSQLRDAKPGIKSTEIARILWIPEAQVKRLVEVKNDLKLIPEEVLEEMRMPAELSPTFTDRHWDSLKKATTDRDLDQDQVKDVCRYIMDNEIPASKVDLAVKRVVKEEVSSTPDEQAPQNIEPESPFKEKYKGMLVEEDGRVIVKGKKEDVTLPVSELMEYVRETSKFKVFVSISVDVKIVE